MSPAYSFMIILSVVFFFPCVIVSVGVMLWCNFSLS